MGGAHCEARRQVHCETKAGDDPDDTDFITNCVKDRQKLLGKIVGGDAFIAPHTRLSKYGMVVDKYIRRTKGIDKWELAGEVIVSCSRVVELPELNPATTPPAKVFHTTATTL